MNIFKQDTDYALRMLVNLTGRLGGEPASTGTLAESEEVSAQFAAKILQQLHKAGLVRSVMGPKGGFELAKDPAEITLREAVEAVQGPVTVNRCSPEVNSCPRKKSCKVSPIVDQLQEHINLLLEAVTLNDL